MKNKLIIPFIILLITLILFGIAVNYTKEEPCEQERTFCLK